MTGGEASHVVSLLPLGPPQITAIRLGGSAAMAGAAPTVGSAALCPRVAPGVALKVSPRGPCSSFWPLSPPWHPMLTLFLILGSCGDQSGASGEIPRTDSLHGQLFSEEEP